MPPQPIRQAGAVGDEIAAVIEQQPDPSPARHAQRRARRGQHRVRAPRDLRRTGRRHRCQLGPAGRAKPNSRGVGSGPLRAASTTQRATSTRRCCSGGRVCSATGVANRQREDGQDRELGALLPAAADYMRAPRSSVLFLDELRCLTRRKRRLKFARPATWPGCSACSDALTSARRCAASTSSARSRTTASGGPSLER
jgi:hypothetical protein